MDRASLWSTSVVWDDAWPDWNRPIPQRELAAEKMNKWMAGIIAAYSPTECSIDDEAKDRLYEDLRVKVQTVGQIGSVN